MRLKSFSHALAASSYFLSWLPLLCALLPLSGVSSIAVARDGCTSITTITPTVEDNHLYLKFSEPIAVKRPGPQMHFAPNSITETKQSKENKTAPLRKRSELSKTWPHCRHLRLTCKNQSALYMKNQAQSLDCWVTRCAGVCDITEPAERGAAALSPTLAHDINNHSRDLDPEP